MLKRLLELNHKWELEGKPVFHTRIGLHTQAVIVGNIGTEECINYTVLGDGVNLVSYLEEANKLYGTRIIASEVIYERLKSKFLFLPVDVVTIKARKKALQFMN